MLWISFIFFTFVFSYGKSRVDFIENDTSLIDSYLAIVRFVTFEINSKNAFALLFVPRQRRQWFIINIVRFRSVLVDIYHFASLTNWVLLGKQRDTWPSWTRVMVKLYSTSASLKSRTVLSVLTWNFTPSMFNSSHANSA